MCRSRERLGQNTDNLIQVMASKCYSSTLLMNKVDAIAEFDINDPAAIDDPNDGVYLVSYGYHIEDIGSGGTSKYLTLNEGQKNEIAFVVLEDGIEKFIGEDEYEKQAREVLERIDVNSLNFV